MQNDVYDYTATGQVAKNTVLQKTYRLLGLSFIPAVAAHISAAGWTESVLSVRSGLDGVGCCAGVLLRHDFPH